ncbi:Cytochrome P450 3A31 [Orchesella cincta]|uniref:Cytochrome P450 3A31 n=1 Tax=Orchesella cincta TaxID=48709 RepID=A0A1D2M8I6_ORCCI|nr:Cytochrome P450 3A31 [Orchesella cincta]
MAYPKYAIDVIASSACGVESKAFEFTEPNGPLSEFERMAAKFQLKFSLTMFLKFLVITILPKVADFFGFEAMDLEPQMYFLSIGSRFALFKVKVAIAALVYNFKLQPSARTQIPVKFGNAATLKPLNGMILNITPR